MKSIKFLFVLFAAITFTVPTFAQEGDRDHRGHRGHGMKHLMKDLNLTDAQEKQMKEIRETYRTKFEALRAQDGDHSAKREQMHQLREEQKAAFEKVLTAEQIATVEAKKAERETKKEAFKKKMKSVDKEAMHSEMKAYKNENMKPVLLGQRKKLESSISAADKAQIETLRATLKAAKKEMKAMKGDRREKHERPTEAQRETWKAMKDKYRPQHEEAKVLVDKYDTQITALLAEIQGERTQWEEDMDGIKDKYFGDIMKEFDEHPRGKKWNKKKGERAEHDGDRAGHHKGKRGHHRGEKGHHKGDKDKITFLLMDIEKAEKRVERKAKKANAIKVFPNPSTTSNSIQYTVSEAGNVKIELHDKSGNVVKEIANEYKTPGDYTETVNLSGLNEVVYFYVITDKNGVRSKKFMVKK